MAPRSLVGPLVAITAFALVLALHNERTLQARAASRPLPAAGTPALTLRNAAPSLEALARGVLDGLSRGDTRAMAALAVTREEYRDVLFPGMPADQRAGADFYYDNMAAGSWKDLGRTVGELGGKAIELRSVQTDPKETERRGDAILHRGITLRVRVEGQERSLVLLGGVVELAGQFKVIRYRRP
ncbi:MAG: hypothetical protein MUF64_11625 [Polyangiaceae bacterium]|jgi:hypothetical protein|nr:hypothetical protein [Polyangiaceae bacterium]